MNYMIYSRSTFNMANYVTKLYNGLAYTHTEIAQKSSGEGRDDVDVL